MSNGLKSALGVDATSEQIQQMRRDVMSANANLKPMAADLSIGLGRSGVGLEATIEIQERTKKVHAPTRDKAAQLLTIANSPKFPVIKSTLANAESLLARYSNLKADADYKSFSNMVSFLEETVENFEKYASQVRALAKRQAAIK